MRVAVLANDNQWQQLIDSGLQNIIRANDINYNAEAWLIVKEDVEKSILNNLNKPVLLNSVIYTLNDLGVAPNVVRINGWNSFLSRKKWEVAGIISDEIKNVFTTLQIEFISVADEVGLIAARPIAMIINEAYFALAENVSTKKEIDIAMKLGTNYPYGPFEWADIIGIKNIFNLLQTLSKKDKRYTPALKLIEEASIV